MFKKCAYAQHLNDGPIEIAPSKAPWSEGHAQDARRWMCLPHVCTGLYRCGIGQVIKRARPNSQSGLERVAQRSPSRPMSTSNRVLPFTTGEDRCCARSRTEHTRGWVLWRQGCSSSAALPPQAMHQAMQHAASTTLQPMQGWATLRDGDFGRQASAPSGWLCAMSCR